MNRQALFQQMQARQSMLCVGLDIDLQRIPAFLKDEADPIFAFNKAIIDATQDYCVAYKPNIAFYEALGSQGWAALERTLDYIPDTHFTIADAKRGDIGNTAKRYAKAFFETLNFDAITVAPYMGEDSIRPFLEFENKWTIVLGLTSNKGSQDFQLQELKDGNPVYRKVFERCAEWGSPDQLMFVVGATHPSHLAEIRQWVPEHGLLVPGIGAQGGDLQGVLQHGANDWGGLLINSARGIIYASSEEDFAEAAAAAARELQEAMSGVLA